MRGSLKRFRIYISCLVLGVGSIAIISSISQAVVNGLSKDGQNLLGGDVSLSLAHRIISEKQHRWLSQWGSVSNIVTMRSMARTNAGKRTLISLKAVDKMYPLYGNVDLTPNISLASLFGYHNGAWGAAVHPNILTRLGIEVGDQITIGQKSFQIRAILKKEPDPMNGVRAITLGPRILISTKGLHATALVKKGAQITYEYRLRLHNEKNLEIFKQELIRLYPDAGWRIRYRTGATVGLDRFISRTTHFMTLVALTALLIGGVGVGNSARDYLKSKTEVIAILKCLGADSRLLFVIFFLQLLIMAAIGISIGLMVGIFLPFFFSATLSEIISVPLITSIYPSAILLGGFFGMLTTAIFSLWPLILACKTKPGSLFRAVGATYDARLDKTSICSLSILIAALITLTVTTTEYKQMAVWFILGSGLTFAMFYLAGLLVMWVSEKFSNNASLVIRLASANLCRPGAQTKNVVLSMGMGLTVMIAVVIVEINITKQLETNLPDRAPDYYFIDIQANQVAAFERTVKTVEGFLELNRVPILRGRIIKVNGVNASKVKIAPEKSWVLRGDRGITWATRPPLRTEIVNGKWWPLNYKGPPLVSLDAAAAVAMGLNVGDTLTVDILGRPITAKISSLRRIDWANLGINFVMVFSPGLIEKAPQTHIATVKLDSNTAVDLENIVTNRFRNVTAVKVRDVLDQITSVIEKIGKLIRTAAIITLFSGILVLGGAISTSGRQRIYDAVVMKVFGARRKQVVSVFAMEYGLIAGATGVISALIGSVTGWSIVTLVMKTAWIPAFSAVAWTVVIVSLFVIFFGLVGTWHALNSKSRQVLRNE